MPPARMRVFTGVRYSRARTMCERSTPRWKLESRRRPSGSAPTTPTRRARPPRAATLLAALPAPPATISVASYLRIRTGASLRDAGDLAVDELVGDDVADDEHPAVRKAVDEREEPLLALGFAGLRMNGTGNQHWRRIQLDGFDEIVHDRIGRADPAAARLSSAAPYPVRTRMPRAPAARAAPTSSHLSPTTNDRAGSRPRSADARSIRPQPGLRQSQRLRVGRHRAVGVVRTIVIRVDARAARVEQRRDMAMHLLDHRLGEHAARHAGLVGDDDDRKAGLIERANGVDRPRKERHLAGARAGTRCLR